MKKIRERIQDRAIRLKGETSIKSILVVCAFVIMAAIMVNSIISNIQLQYQKSQLSNQLFETKNQNKALEQKLEQASTNRYVEEVAREELGMVKSNEVPIKVVEKQVKSETSSKLKSSDKIGIYMKDWYSEIESWVTKRK
ncbi:hypothetical protein CN918_27805 [Priestia megaterium]|nr:hypothetical protein CN918_27805 [Priestia megaterium]